ncbi:MAG: hypothetical protein Q8L34_01425, partial [Candidatus Woesearchaeota archaeon]|nr:hypothetical protein [Candidatus Woesearchaeota archaeon]
MPYDGEFAHYGPLNRLAESELVKSLLKSARIYNPESEKKATLSPKQIPITADSDEFPIFAIAIDGSSPEITVKNGYPGARVGYCSIASVLLDLEKIEELDQQRPINPIEFRKTQESTGIDAAFPGSNV